jgi:predicted secreted protein
MKTNFYLLLVLLCLKTNAFGLTTSTEIYNISVYDTLKLSLTSNKSTGYAWHWTNKSQVTKLDSVANDYIYDQPVMPGSAGKEIWKFKGKYAGADTIQIIYSQWWDKSSTIESKLIVVNVAESKPIQHIEHYQISVNDTLKRLLTSNPSTGYGWHWKNKKNVAILDSISHNYIANQPCCGSNETEVWGFKGKSTGIDTIQLVYCRPWDKTSNKDTMSMIIHVIDPKITTSNYQVSVNDTMKLVLYTPKHDGHYGWVLENKETVTKLDYVSDKYVRNPVYCCGMYGNEEWIFRGKTLGNDSIRLRYCHFWEGSCITLEKKLILVKVNEPNPVGIDSNDIKNIILYPNPTSGLLNISNLQSMTENSIQIFNLQGIKLLDKKINSESKTLNIESLESGSYIINILENNQLIFTKLIQKI